MCINWNLYREKCGDVIALKCCIFHLASNVKEEKYRRRSKQSVIPSREFLQSISVVTFRSLFGYTCDIVILFSNWRKKRTSIYIVWCFVKIVFTFFSVCQVTESIVTIPVFCDKFFMFLSIGEVIGKMHFEQVKCSNVKNSLLII